MNTATQVSTMIDEWKQSGIKKPELVVKIAEACMEWSYVWGGYGQFCTSKNRESYASRSSCPSGESAVIRKKCQILNGSKGSCSGCKWYPNGTTRFFDCRGFTRWVLGQVGISLQGAGATSQWNDDSNWVVKGDIRDMPSDAVCCVFMADGKTMSHTGLHVGGNNVIHCSGEVKRGKTTDRGWTHYAIPKGLDGNVPIERPTLRKGSQGEYVTLLQTKLIQQGYDLAPYGADGKFGNKTFEAVKAFQRNHNLVVDGICGSATWTALDNSPPKPVLYTVHIPFMTEDKANALLAQYSGSWKTAE